VFLWRADHSPRGGLPAVVRRCVWSGNLVNEKVVAHWGGGLSRQKQTKSLNFIILSSKLEDVGRVAQSV
jgi:hypothetical protein